MNERIKELIEQATESTGFLTAGDSVKPLPVREFNKVKFAELIVRECIDTMTQMPRYARTPITKDIENATIEDCINTVKNHFGVKS
jgi:hypothetical protein